MTWNERRQELSADLSIFTATVTTNLVPNTNKAATFTFTGLNSIDTILNVRIVSTTPAVANVQAPQYGANTANNAVGITLAAGTGTTISAECVLMGH